MSHRMTDDFIDDLPETQVFAEDEADAAFWDEFFFLEERRYLDDRSYTITVEDEFTGEKKVYKHVRLQKAKKRAI